MISFYLYANMGSILSKPKPESTMVFYYSIVADNNVIYVGRTFDFKERCSSHKRSTNNPPRYQHLTYNNTPLYKRIRELGGWSKVSMNVLEQKICNSKEKMSLREEYWINKYESIHLTNVALRQFAGCYSK